jgi:D-alanine-D-alanine ligase
VLAALRSSGVDAHAFDPSERDLSDLLREGYARCFIALHGRHGEDGTVQGALELLGIPYTGSGVMASAVSIDKVMTKRLWLADGLPTPRWVWLAPEQRTREAVRAVPDELGLPLIVKPPREGSSIGVTKVLGYSQMDDAVNLSLRYDPDVLCEEFIDGDEITCPVLGSGVSAQALPVIRIVAPRATTTTRTSTIDDTLPVPERPCAGRGGSHPTDRAGGIPRARLPSAGVVPTGWRRARPRAVPAEPNTSPGMTGHSLARCRPRRWASATSAVRDAVARGGASTPRCPRRRGRADGGNRHRRRCRPPWA